MAKSHGIHLTGGSAAQYLIRTGWQPEAALERVLWLRERTARVMRPAQEHRPTMTENQRAECGCRDCVGELFEQLGGLAVKSIIPGRPPSMEYEDARQEMFFVLLAALRSWPGRGNFAPWFVQVGRAQMADYRKREVVQGRHLTDPFSPADFPFLEQRIAREELDPYRTVVARETLRAVVALGERMRGGQVRVELSTRAKAVIHETVI